MLDFAYYSGWRRQEITGLTWAEVDLKSGVVRLHPDRSKTDEGRVLPLSAPLRAVLVRRQAARRLDVPLVFHRDGLPIQDWRRRWTKACTLANVPGRLLHDCRRTAARNLIRAGVPETVAMKLTGHKSRSVFNRYAIVDEKDLQSAADRMAAYAAAQPTERNVVTIESKRIEQEEAAEKAVNE